MAAYRIKDWTKVFYLARAYEAGEVSWVRFPVDRKGAAYIHLMTTREGRDAYIVFVAMVRLVARAKSTGTINVPNYVIAAEACLPEKIVKRSIEILLAEPVKWLENGSAADSEKPPRIRHADAENPPRGSRNALQEEEEEKDSSSSILGIRRQEARTPEPAAAAEASHDEGERNRKIEALCKRPIWLRDGQGWIDTDGAREILGLPGMHQGIWDEVVKQAKSDKNLKNPAGYIRSKIRQRLKAGGAA